MQANASGSDYAAEKWALDVDIRSLGRLVVPIIQFNSSKCKINKQKRTWEGRSQMGGAGFR